MSYILAGVVWNDDGTLKGENKMSLAEELKKKKRKYITIRNSKSKWLIADEFYYYQGKIDELTEIITLLEKRGI